MDKVVKSKETYLSMMIRVYSGKISDCFSVIGGVVEVALYFGTYRF